MNVSMTDEQLRGVSAASHEATAESGRFRFWRGWLIAASIVFALQGAYTAVFASPDPFDWWAGLASDHFWGAEQIPESVAPYHAVLAAILGGALAGYFVLVGFIAWVPFRRREPWAWYAIACGVLAWFAIDSGMCLVHRAHFNVWAVNVPALVALGLPLAATYNEFRRRAAP
jgi:hypothetical protein